MLTKKQVRFSVSEKQGSTELGQCQICKSIFEIHLLSNHSSQCKLEFVQPEDPYEIINEQIISIKEKAEDILNSQKINQKKLEQLTSVHKICQQLIQNNEKNPMVIRKLYDLEIETQIVTAQKPKSTQVNLLLSKLIDLIQEKINLVEQEKRVFWKEKKFLQVQEGADKYKLTISKQFSTVPTVEEFSPKLLTESEDKKQEFTSLNDEIKKRFPKNSQKLMIADLYLEMVRFNIPRQDWRTFLLKCYSKGRIVSVIELYQQK